MHRKTLTVIPFTEAHLAPFTTWFNALPENDVWTTDWVRSKTLDDPNYDPGLMLAAQDGDTPVGCVLGNIVDDKGWIKAFLVRPDCQRQGIGTMLFETVERAFAQRGIEIVTVGYAPLYYFIPGINLKYTSAVVFLDQRGYQTDRTVRVNLDVLIRERDFDTAASEARLRERGIVVRRGTLDDVNALVELCNANGYQGWMAESRIALQKIPPTVFVAERDGDVLAFAAHSVVGPLHFGPMLTSPDLRGIGIGSVLLKRCLVDWQRAGHDRCEIIWAGPISFYARVVGATMGSAFWIFRKSL
jgi:GNAT superfamily N-acetyltransferase